MAIIRMRDLYAVARSGETFVGPEDYTWELSLADLYGMTVPSDWEPPLPDLADWQAGAYELVRESAEKLTTDLNNEHPWEP